MTDAQPALGHRPGPSTAAILAVVGFSVFVAADDLTVVATMLRPIISDLGLVLPDGLDDAAWIVNVYLIAFVAVMPIAGRISDIVGRRRTFVVAYVLFIIGSIVIPSASTMGPFLVGRVLTAIGGGAMVPVALAVVGDVYPPQSRARALGTLGAIETLGWVWGPLYGAILVRFLSWQWQFWLNIPLALIGLGATWWALAEHDRPARGVRVDWVGALLVTVALVSLNVALLGSSEIQSVTGLDELTDGGGADFRWLYAVAVVAVAAFVWHQRRVDHPLVNPRLFRGRNVRLALVTNFVVGAAVVIAMVDVPLFVNAVEGGLERSALIAGWVLAVLTASMAVASYAGGRLTERTWYKPPAVAGLVAASVAYVAMGFGWGADTSYGLIGFELALLGAGFGLTVAPTNSAVISAAPADQRGSAAALVMVTRLLGFSVGLSALTAWGLSRFNSLRRDLKLPPITDPKFGTALRTAQEDLTSKAIAETFLATAAITVVGAGAAMAMRRRGPDGQPAEREDERVDDQLDEQHDEQQDEQTGAAVQQSWLHRHLAIVLGAFALILVGAFAFIAVLVNRLDQTNKDLDRVEAGSALFAAQVTGFQTKLAELAPQVSQGVDEAIAGLETFGTSTIEFDVPIDQNIAINTEVVIDRDIEVPIKTTLPIKDSFDTTIKVAGPFGIDIPLDVTVPVDIDVPIDLTVTVPINETVPIDANVPVKLNVPIRVEVGDTELAELTKSLAAGLRSLQAILAGLGG
jgi:EmrB/QacA subfamily drug resistance transporter